MARLYTDLASWWPLMSAPEEYEIEASTYARTIIATRGGRPGTLLELGSGGGNNASYMKEEFVLTLVEPSAGMLAHSRTLNPECEHVQGDMRTVRLGRLFDAVFVHDAVTYMTTEDDLRLAIETAFVHCAPGGVALFCPDAVRENFVADTEHGGNDGRGDDRRSMRWVAWTFDPDPTDDTYTVDYAFILHEADGSVRVEADRHIEGLFSRETWLRLFRDVGFEADIVPFEHPDVESGRYEMFACRRSAVTAAERASLVDRLKRDVRATIGSGYERIIEREADQAAGYCDSLGWFAERVVEETQQYFHDARVDTDWPLCPVHRRHPLWLSGGLVWRCGDEVAIPLGELGVAK